MDLDGNLGKQTSTDMSGSTIHYLPLTVKNLKRKAQHALACQVAKFPTEHQHLLTLTQVPVQAGTTGKWQEQKNPSVLLQEADGRTCGS